MLTNDWRSCFVIFWPVTLTDGSKGSGLLMRRKTSSGREYRKLTVDEEADYMSASAW